MTVRCSLVLLALAACPAGRGPADAGAPVACSSTDGCPDGQVCRAAACTAEAPCGNDLECQLGEQCAAGQCRFTGCRTDADCTSGTCLAGTFTCGECVTAGDCPAARPVCTAHACVACTRDDECPSPGPHHCSNLGACAHCLTDAHCPNGLTCSPTAQLCEGVGEQQPCPAGTACANGLVCVNTGGATPTCLRSCDVYTPSCPLQTACQHVTAGGSLVFGLNGPLGVCLADGLGTRGPHEPCTGPPLASVCRGDLACIPDSATASTCHAFCNPASTEGCAVGERCASFPGDGAGRRYGVCLPNNGYADVCVNDATCRTGLSCQPLDDPQSITDLSPRCRFDVGTSAGLAPCSPVIGVDGGVQPDVSCRTGACVNDPYNTGPAFHCFAACHADADCSIGTRRGICDASFTFRTVTGAAGSLIGCRPGCAAFDECAEYGANSACHVQFTRSFTPGFISTCGPKTGAGGPGEGCYAHYQCRSGYCSLDDGRGAQHPGFCSEPCTTAAQCANDAGSPLMPMDCADTPVLGTYGRDGLGGTVDDLVLVRKLCTGPVCTLDGDCGAIGACVPDVDPANPGAATVLRCKPAEQGGKVGGDSCMLDIECTSGVCARRPEADGGQTRLCFEACTASSVCPGSTTCKPGVLKVQLSGGLVGVDSCAP